MMLSNFFFLFAAGLTGVYSERVSKLSVKTGGFISIPCLYEAQYVNNVKYLCMCAKYLWKPCTPLAETAQSGGSEKYSIVDDTVQHVFTVTIRDLTVNSCYLCGVSKPLWDLKHKISLVVTTGVPSLYVERQNITAVPGGSVTVMCHYKTQKRFQWCKFGGECVKASAGVINGLTVTITTSVPTVANVTMSGLRKENSGWYFCENGELQMPVYVTISKDVTTATPTIPPHFTGVTHSSSVEPLASIFSSQPSTDLPINSSVTEGDNNRQQEQKNTTKLVIVIATSSVLLVLIVGGAAWKIKRCYVTIPEESAAAQDPQTVKDPDVLYSDIIHMQQLATKKEDQTPDERVIYSTIVI